VPEETKTGAYLKVEGGNRYWERWAAGMADWRCLEMRIRVPEKTQWLTLKVGSSGLRGWCWFDDVEVVELPEAPTPGERPNDLQPVPGSPS